MSPPCSVASVASSRSVVRRSVGDTVRRIVAPSRRESNECRAAPVGTVGSIGGMDGTTDSVNDGTRPAEGTGGRTDVVRPVGELDWESGQEFAEEVRAVLDARPDLLVIDLSAVSFADSSALHTLLAARDATVAAGARLVLAGPLANGVDRLFEVSGTREFFAFAPTPEAALADPSADPSADPGH